MKNWITIVVLVVVVSVSTAQNHDFMPSTSAKSVLHELAQKSQETKTLKADFVSNKYLSFLTAPQKSTGVFYFVDGKIRWEQQTPSSYIILVNDNGLRISDSGKEIDVAHAGRVGQQIGELIAKLVGGEYNDPKMFTNSVFENNEYWKIALHPVNKRLRQLYSHIELVFDKKTKRLYQLTFHEVNGDKNEMTFSNHEINVEIDPQLFNSF